MTDADRRRHEDAKLAYDALMKFYPLTLEDLPDEIWRETPYCSDYLVSNFGRAKSFKNGKAKILKPNIRSGYLSVQLSKDGKQKNFVVHRLVAQAFIPNPEGKPEVNHIDGHPLNDYVGNLEWATQSENIRHAFNIGSKINPQGEDCSWAKLTNEQVVQIRTNPDGLNLKQLAEKFGVHENTISQIQRGRNFKNAGGTIRKPKVIRVSEEMRSAIRAAHKPKVRGCGYKSLAKNFGLNIKTIIKILHET